MQWQYMALSQADPVALEQTRQLLSPSRSAHIDRFRRQADRDRSLAGEYLLRQLLKTGWGMEDPCIIRLESGAVALMSGALHLSIAHSGELVACAVSQDPVGIDVEQINPFRSALISKICTPEEADYVTGGETLPALCDTPQVMERFYRIWTGKEAWFKLQGTGITDLKSVNVLQLPCEYHRAGDYQICILEK